MTPFSVKKENDTSLEEGTEKVIEQGRQGYTTSTYRVYYDENGNEIKREKVATSYYPPRQKVVSVGVKRENIIDESVDTGTTNRPQGSNVGSSSSTGNRPGNSGSSGSTGNRPGNGETGGSTDNKPGNSETGGSADNKPGNGGTEELSQPEDNNVY